ncbi:MULTISPECIES: glycine betaine ABC transporter substrate-binding protein [Thermomonosporaceae]|uniref:glycine betaine ABC transporter substrate-binding protein n=1 Tax=Thermomonosporaceae TaxID=2012 RepID=UPI00255AC21F|nr:MULTISPECIES: glycine betaine ABC transporter substrate-binding protein [Thermomonosporaceae]MDL4772187.1 glycine betaine ABC transporter substrate-binding protein [Actinomadura xylanilytica]
MTVEPLRSGDPESIGGYRLAGRVGEGGQGVVYLAEPAEAPGRRVALKVPHSAPGGGASIDLDEIAIIQRVARFCTARVLDAGIDGDRPYLVSEYIDGPSLQSVVESGGALRGSELERLAVGTITALAATHGAGVVHRDFKPHNVLLAADGPRVIDFGVATTLGRSGEGRSGPSGTPRYMAPEQVRGAAVGAAADVHGWAVTMTFAAIGSRAFDDVLPTGSHRPLQVDRFLVDLPLWLRTVVAPCLDEDPEQRPRSRELLLHLLGHDQEALRRSSEERSEPPVRPPVPEAAPPLPRAPTVGRRRAASPPRPPHPGPADMLPGLWRRYPAVTFVAALVLAGALAAGVGARLGSPPAGHRTRAAGAAPATAPSPRLTVGSADFPENVLLSEIYAQALVTAGFKVTRMRNIGPREVYFPKVLSGEVDVVPEYNGALASHLGGLGGDTREPMTTGRVNGKLGRVLPDSLRVLDSARAENNDAIAVTRETARKNGLHSLADLKGVSGDLVLGAAPEFETRHQGLVGLREVYKAAFKDFQPVRPEDHTMLAEQLTKGTLDVVRLFTTDPAIRTNDLMVLTDPKHMFSAQNVTPLVAADVGAKAAAALNAVSARLTTEDLLYMNTRMAVDRSRVEAMAKAWLVQTGLG